MKQRNLSKYQLHNEAGVQIVLEKGYYSWN